MCHQQDGLSRRIGGNRTDAWFDIWVELGQPSANQAFLGDIANEAMRNYFAGNWINAMWFTSSNINREGGTAGTAGVFHSEAIALDTRRPPRFEPERDASARSW